MDVPVLLGNQVNIMCYVCVCMRGCHCLVWILLGHNKVNMLRGMEVITEWLGKSLITSSFFFYQLDHIIFLGASEINRKLGF